MTPSGPAPKAVHTFVRWSLRYARVLWLVALVLAVPAVWRTVQLYAHLKSELSALLPRQAASVVAIDELSRRMPGLQYLGVVVDTGTAEQLPAGEKFVDDLAARVKTYPPELVRSVRLGDAEEKKFLEKNAPLYTDLEDLKIIRARIEARRDYEVSKATGGSLEDDEPPALDFSDIEKKYKERTGGAADRFPNGRFSSKEQHMTLLLIEVGEFSTGRGPGTLLLDRVKADIAALGGTDHYAPNMRHGFTGDVAISVEETSALMADLSFSSAVVLVLVVAVLVIYYRWYKSVLVLMPPLLLAAAYSFALASLFGVSELNSNTAFLGSIIVGNGINFSIILLARYVEERRHGVAIEESLATALWASRMGTLPAALAAGVSYASLGLTDFRGFAQFGVIGGIGMVLAWVTSFFLVPSLARALDDLKPTQGNKGALNRLMTPIADLVTRRSGIVLALAAVMIVFAVREVSRFGGAELETDFSKLRRADTWETGEGYWGRRMDQLLGSYLTPTVILTDSHEQARAVAAAVREVAKREPMSDMISNVRTIDDVLPADQAAKIEEAEAIREDMTPKMRSLVPEDKRAQLERLLDGGELKPVAMAELPHIFTTGLREKDGSYGRAVLVFPRPSHALWEGPPLAAFVENLRTIAREAGAGPGVAPARVAGSLPLSADILESIRRDGVRASAVALVGVMVVVLAIFRGGVASMLVIGALSVGVLWLGAAMMLFGVRINFANFIAFPITFGIGVDYSVNVVARYLQEGKRNIGLAVRATGGAVTLCSLTTIIGYSSLLMAENRALFLFGLVAVLGEVCCLFAAIVALPAFVSWLDTRRRGAPLPEPSSGSQPRWR